MTKQVWRHLDSGWEVEWCEHLPMLPDDPETCDRDNAKMVVRNFRTKEEADAYAREVYPRDQFGAVSVTPFCLEKLEEADPFSLRHNCHKEYTGDPEYYEGEET